MDLKNHMREYVNNLIELALTEGNNPPPLDIARRWMHEDTIDALPCSSCGEPVLDMDGREGIHVHSFKIGCDEDLIVARLGEAARGVQHADLELEDAALGWITYQTRNLFPDAREIQIEVEWGFHDGTPVITAHPLDVQLMNGKTVGNYVRDSGHLDEALIDWLPEFADAAKLEAGTHWVELHP